MSDDTSETNLYHAFLSHSSADKPIVEAFARKLRQEQIAVFVDKWHLVIGNPIQPALEEALERSETCVVFFGPSGVGPWQNEELRAAIRQRVYSKDNSFRVIPVVLPGANRGERSHIPSFLQDTLWVEFEESIDEDESWQRLVSGIRGVPVGPTPEHAPFPGECPYLGLHPFDREHKKFFYGRDTEVDWMLEHLSRDFGGPHENRFLAVIAASGSGKSSLVRAGLLPALEQGRSRSGKRIAGSQEWPIVILKPGSDPLKALADQLWHHPLTKEIVGIDRREYADRLNKDPHKLHDDIGTALAKSSERSRFVIVVDQMEELFTLTVNKSESEKAERERQAFIDNLVHAGTARGGKTLVIITMRADFYPMCTKYENLTHVLSDHQELVPPMSENNLREAIITPAQMCGLSLEPGLTDLLIQEMRNQPAGSLPLLQETLLQLWQKRKVHELTIPAYRDIGGIEGALEKHANNVYNAQLKTDEERTLCRRLLLTLIEPGEGAADTRKRIPRAMLGDSEETERILQELAKARLITFVDEDQPQVEITHEALINGWGVIRKELNEDRESVRTLHELLDASRMWHESDHDKSYLYSGLRLLNTEEWVTKNQTQLSELPIAQQFLQAAAKNRDRQRRWSRIARISLVCLTLISVGSFIVIQSVNSELETTVDKLEDEQKQTNLQLANNEFLLGSFARDENDEIRAGHYFLRAAKAALDADDNAKAKSYRIAAQPHLERIDRTILGQQPIIKQNYILTIQADMALLWSKDQFKLLHTYHHDDLLTGACFSPNEQQIFTWSDSGIGKLWSINQSEPLLTIIHDNEIRGAIFTADGQYFLTWGLDMNAILWSVDHSKPLHKFKHDQHIGGAVFGANEQQILTWDFDSAKLWLVDQDDPLQTFTHESAVVGAVFSDDKHQILTWELHGSAKLWSVDLGEPLRTFSPSWPVNGAKFVANEQQVLAWERNNDVKLWSVDQDEPLRTFIHDDQVEYPGGLLDKGILGAVFTTDEQQLLTWRHEGSAKLWSIDQDEPLRTFTHSGSVNGALFTTDEQHVFTWSRDKSAKLWAINQDEPICTFQNDNSILGANFAVDNQHVFIWSENNTARQWSIDQDKPIRTFTHKGSVEGAVFTAGDKQILTWSSDGSAKLWSVDQDEPLRTFIHGNNVSGAVLSIDEQQFLTWGSDGEPNAKLWSIDNLEPLRSFPHRGAMEGAAFSIDRKQILTWGRDERAKLWAVDRSDPLRNFCQGCRTFDVRHIHEAVFLANEKQIFTRSRAGSAELWTVHEDESLRTFTDNSGFFGAVFTADEQQFLTWNGDGEAKIWSINEDEPLRIFKHDTPAKTGTMNSIVLGANFLANEQQILTWGEHGNVILWSVDQDEPLRFFKHNSRVLGLISLVDEKEILTWCEDGSVTLWSVDYDEPLRIFLHDDHLEREQFEKGVHGATFTADNKQILTWGGDGTAKLWSIYQDKPLRTFTHASDVTGAVFTTDEKQVLTWSKAGVVKLWDISIPKDLDISEQITDFERRTATRIDFSGQLQVLTLEQLLERQASSVEP